jgi:DNA-directed RNA polymerase specialized sigma24 family protein
MSVLRRQRLEEHLRRHARMLRNIARGFGRHRDADDIIQILYSRWWRRIERDPSWSPPESAAELFVCVKRVVLDEIAKERRLHAHRHDARPYAPADNPEESLHAFQRLQWILARLPAPFAEALQASLAAGRRKDAAVAEELGLTPAAYTARLFKARRAAEELASFYDLLSPEQASLMAELRYSGKARSQIAHELSLLSDELTQRWQQALDVLEQHGVASAQ